MFTPAVRSEIATVARDFGLDPALLLAVASVESGGKAFERIDGRQEPLIRFEGHYFDRRLSGARQAEARSAGLAHPAAGQVKNPRSQAARWKMLDRAAGIDRKAACESTSWGIGQVMGAHWAWLGFASVDALVQEARSGASGQARLMARYIEKAGLAAALKSQDWAAFARGYNGPGYKRNGYDAKLAAAFAKHVNPGTTGTKTTPLRQGASGQAVEDLQRLLSANGYPVGIDGAFGMATAAAVRRFQRDRGLAADGVVGPATIRELRGRSPASAAWRRIAAWLASLFGKRLAPTG